MWETLRKIREKDWVWPAPFPEDALDLCKKLMVSARAFVSCMCECCLLFVVVIGGSCGVVGGESGRLWVKPILIITLLTGTRR